MDSSSYFVIDAATGNKYGPADLATLNQWVTEGRILPSTMLEDALGGAQIRADRLPGLMVTRAASAPPSMSPPPEARPMSPTPAYHADEGWRGYPIGVHFDFLNDSWGLMKQSWQAWVPVLGFMLLAYLVCQIPGVIAVGLDFFTGNISFDQRFSGSNMALSSLSSLLTLFVMYPLYTGGICFALDIVDGKQPQFARLFTPYKRWFGSVGSVFIYYLLMTIGSFLCLLPGLYLAGRLFYWPVMIAEERMSFMDTFSYVWERQAPFAWAMFGLLFVASLLTCLGVLALVVGLLATIPMGYLTLACQYRAMYPEFAPKADVVGTA
ncbi:MAG: hypothetical protein HONBIEJF_01912 [Fimbriimonadaceae bacterium]|nr:hypothetical protein [Fimbriimonadaceae bacterium]